MWRRCVAMACLWLGCSGGWAAANPLPPAPKPAVAELLEDNGEALLKQFNNPGGDFGQGFLETNILFSGKSSIKIVPLQRYSPALPGWNFLITENPKPGEYRYLRLAWKAVGCAGVMVQFHDEKDWNLRYVAGNNQQGWGSQSVHQQPPTEWTLVTRDLFKDFGTRTLKGMALTVFGGTAAYFDHIYLGRTLDDLDRINATGLGKNGKPVVLKAGELDQLWKELAAEDASKVYLAFWTLAADAKQAVPYLSEKLQGPKKTDLKQVKQWIIELDDPKYLVRQKASQQLEKHLELAADLLELELQKNPSAEACLRIENLLALRKIDGEGNRLEKAVLVLEYTATPAAIKTLTQLAAEADKALVRKAASGALKRIKATGG